MADHAKPILTDNYTDVLSQIRGRFEDQANGFDPANTAATNISTGTIRWTSASNKWQKWSGTAWTDLSSLYAININGNAATATNASTVTNGVYTVGDQTIAGVKTFSSTIQASISGNAGTVTNGVYTTGDQTINGVKTFSSNTIFNGNLGLGVVPSAWGFGGNLELPSTNNISFQGSGNLLFNAFYSLASGGYVYKTTAGAGRYQSAAGQHIWFTAPSGTAGNTISFTQAMTLDANGNLGIGTSSPSAYSGYKTLAIVGGGNGGVIDINPSGGVTFGGLQIASTASATNLDFYGASGGPASYLAFRSGTYASLTERMRIDSNGKLILSAANQGIQFADGTTQTTAGINPATAAAGAIGTMAMCKYTGTGSVTFGTTKNASELAYSDASGQVIQLPVAGNTWRCLGACNDTSEVKRVTVWVRVS